MHKAQKLKAGGKLCFFVNRQADNCDVRKEVLGGKGASLVAMTRAGLPVPPGFIIPISCCRHYYENDGRWPGWLEPAIRENMTRLESATGKTFGGWPDPLLVSVRSGAAASMPGMLDTILNCGLTPAMVTGHADVALFGSVFGRFVEQFGTTVAGLPRTLFDAGSKADGARLSPKALAESRMRRYEELSGKPFPKDSWSVLFECVNAIFRSWGNERAVIYRKAHGLDRLEGTAVIVQSMFNAEVSGVGFTVNPANPDAGEIVIESGYGLGESIVSGEVDPDHFVLDASSLAVKERVIGNKAHAVYGLGAEAAPEKSDPKAPSLSDAQAVEIARLALDVERHFGLPVDIEWGYANGRFALLQSRPIRGLDVSRDVEAGRREEIHRLRAISGQKAKIWVAHNLGETLPCPTPMTWDVMRRFMSGRGGYGKMYLDFGYRPSKVVCEQGFLELICGRIYADPDLAASSFWDGLPLCYDTRALMADPRLIESAPRGFDAGKTDEKFLLKLPGVVRAMIAASKRLRRLRANAEDTFGKVVLPGYLAYIEQERGRDLTELSVEGLIRLLEERTERVMTEFGSESLKPGFFGGCARAELEEMLVRILGNSRGLTLCYTLTSGLENDPTLEQNQLLFDVANGKADMGTFLSRHGHRAVGEMELKNPRWREDPSYLHKVTATGARGESDAPFRLHRKNAHRREAAMAELLPLLKAWGGGYLFDRIRSTAREAQRLLPYRETGKHYLMMGYELIRAVLVEIGTRFEIADDVFFLRRHELDAFRSSRGAFQREIDRRKTRWLSAARLDMPQVISTDNLESLGLPREIVSSAEYKAKALSGGIVEGRAHIVFDPGEAGEPGADCILVCPSTDPSWTALFTTIKGLIVEQGGVLSHGAIAARDFSIPAVACPDATRMIPEGSRVRVNGDIGHVAIIKD